VVKVINCVVRGCFYLNVCVCRQIIFVNWNFFNFFNLVVFYLWNFNNRKILFFFFD
jgi:hypothetical protein